ncbi:flagellar basal body P-ring protein FlgI [Enterobacter ludwigii]
MKGILSAVAATCLLMPVIASAQSLESLVSVEGIRDNQLVGYSLVVGLDGTGDRNQVKFTNQTLTNMLRQFGVQLPGKIDPKVKNVAAVAVSASLPPMYSRGQKIDITVSSIGDAKSLRGGTLLLTQLHGADGEVYALAQGSVVVGGMNAAGNSGSSVTVNTPTAGLIPNGATVEREIPSDFNMGDSVTLNLKRPSFKDANNIAMAINSSFGGGVASAKSATSVSVLAPTDPGARVAFMSRLDDVQVNAERVRARVVFNSRTGTVVMGDGVRLHAAAVSHGSLTVSISESRNVSQPNAFANGRTVNAAQSNVSVNRPHSQMITLPESTSLRTLVSALNGLGASPDDVMSILQALHEAGALDADLEVI